MKKSCQVPGHGHRPLTLICTNPICKKNRLACSKCLVSFHHDCRHCVIEIEDISKKALAENINWFRDNDIKQAISFISDYNLTSVNQIVSLFEEIINREFEDITQQFLTKIQETKTHIVNNAKTLCLSSGVDLESFMKQLGHLYNFDTLLSILEPLKYERKDPETINQELTDFFEEINSDIKRQMTIQTMAKKINWLTEGLLKIELTPFDTLRPNLSLEMFDNFPSKQDMPWSWDSTKKSSCISLNHNNLVAKVIKSIHDWSPAVVGSTEFSKGRHKWEIEVVTGYPDHFWISFGIIEPHLIKSLDKFPYNQSLRISTQGGASLLDGVSTLGNYDNKTYLCDLDMDKGIFSISHEGQLVAQQQNGLKGKVFLPFAAACATKNTIRLRVIKD